MKPKHPQTKKTAQHASRRKHQAERERRLLVQRKKEEAK